MGKCGKGGKRREKVGKWVTLARKSHLRRVACVG
jgi:hypothetical protein